MSKPTKAEGKRQTLASVAAEVAELRADLGEVLSLLKSGDAEHPAAQVREAAEPQVTNLPSRKRTSGQRRRVAIEELRGEESGGDNPLFTISAAAERAREHLREEFKQLRTGIEELLEELPEEEGR
jgi:ElaB/YqjD/DUF883 family membrane-anchored ribosome-binding protein